MYTTVIYFSCVLIWFTFGFSDDTIEIFFEDCFNSLQSLCYLIKMHFLQQKYLHCKQTYLFFEFRNLYVEHSSLKDIFEFDFSRKLLFSVDNISLTYQELKYEEDVRDILRPLDRNYKNKF